MIVRVDVIDAMRPMPVAQQAPERFGVLRADLREEAVLAGDVVDLEHLGDLGHPVRGLLRPGRIAVAHEDEGEQRQLDRRWIDRARCIPG